MQNDIVIMYIELRKETIMKKFITTIPPMQRPWNLKDGKYNATNNEKLNSSIETCFPVLPLVKGYSDDGEEVEIITIFTDDDKCVGKDENGNEANISKLNYDRFKEQAKNSLSGINYKINEIAIKYDESVEAHLNTFIRIIEQINEGDTICADITFGTKPLPIIEIMALNYALRVKKDVIVDCLSYGGLNFNTYELEIYDVTSLLYMDEMINNMAKMNVEDPLSIIKAIIE